MKGKRKFTLKPLHGHTTLLHYTGNQRHFFSIVVHSVCCSVSLFCHTKPQWQRKCKRHFCERHIAYGREKNTREGKRERMCKWECERKIKEEKAWRKKKKKRTENVFDVSGKKSFKKKKGWHFCWEFYYPSIQDDALALVLSADMIFMDSLKCHSVILVLLCVVVFTLT